MRLPCAFCRGAAADWPAEQNYFHYTNSAAEGGLLLSNNHRGDAVDAARDGTLSLLGAIRTQKGKYKLTQNSAQLLAAESTHRPDKRYLHRTSRGYQYAEDETY